MLADSEQLQAELTLRGLALGDAVCVSQVIQAASDSVWQAISNSVIRFAGKPSFSSGRVLGRKTPLRITAAFIINATS